MPLPTHRLNLLLVPRDPDRAPAGASVATMLAALRQRGVLDASDRPGTRADALMEGAFALLRADFPPAPVLYGNRQGGFSAACPTCGASVVGQLGAALRAWRQGEGRAFACPRCAGACALETLRYGPPAAPGRFALELRDVFAPELRAAEDVRALFEQVLGEEFLEIASRGP